MIELFSNFKSCRLIIAIDSINLVSGFAHHRTLCCASYIPSTDYVVFHARYSYMVKVSYTKNELDHGFYHDYTLDYLVFGCY